MKIHMRQTMLAALVALACALTLAAAPAGSARAQMPRSFGIGTNPQGSLFYAAGSAVAKVLSGHMPVPVRVQPHAGSSVVMPLIDNGELELGVNNTNDARMSLRGLEPFLPTPKLRLVSVLFPLRVAFFVPGNSDIHRVEDLKGHRVAGEYHAHLAVWFNATSIMAGAGVDWDDVTMVPTANVVTGAQALIEGRVDAAAFAVGAGKVKEANASVPGGIRFIPINTSPEGIRKMQEVMPGTYPIQVKGGSTAGVLEDITVEGYDVFLTTGTHMSDEAVAALVKALAENEQEVKQSFPPMRAFARSRMVKENATIPYHPGAVQAYKELGLWSAEMDRVQQQLLSEVGGS